MKTLKYGRKLPETGNKGAVVFDALTNNINIDDAHEHNGINSEKVKSFNLTRGTRSIPAASFTLDPDSKWYYANVEMPAGYSLDTCTPSFFIVGGDYGGTAFIPTWNRNNGAVSLTVWLPGPQALEMVCV